MAVDHIAVGIDLVADFVAHVRRDRTVPLSAQIKRDAQRGNQFAARVVRSGILKPAPAAARSKRPAPAAPQLTARQVEAQRRSEAIRRRLERQAEESGIAWYLGAQNESKFLERRYPRARS